ncbi:MAG: TetR/AcrR family transcriptional regulator [Cyclobacteriaceae bacterium]|nr:TetR/AcrR family transcriptional regulator [Cyclobacteriaceae bacterium]MDH4295931.1 TetR/AcrR family transcriptional regulator [Cyclobacteriaceae bacterium]MDH5249443.1 TetR/AcrR family transcriptional regulator [Cyclobacteriaceae bacterium]
MRNPEQTRKAILLKSGNLFNTQGYKATSISDITLATGFTKGAIYRHFTNKDALEMETLMHLSSLMFAKLREVIVAQATAGNKIRAVFAFFESYITNPPLKGGCPLMNAAIEADDANPALRKTAQKVLHVLRESIITVLTNGIKHKQIEPGIDKAFYATLIIASLEGAIMMGKLGGNDHDIKRVIKHLNKQLQEIER